MIKKNLTNLDEFMKILILLTFTLILNGCSLITPTESGNYKKSLTVSNNLSGHLPSAWTQISNESADFAILNNLTHSVFLFNSACRKFEASDLNSLVSSMLTGVEIVKTIEKKFISYQNRDAIDMTVLGKVDGIERYFHLLTTNKNNCIYDFVLISTNEKYLNEDGHYFQDFIQRIKIN
jgi:hypothetical protein